jgi:hypothetical protein
MKNVDLVGNKYGRLVVKERYEDSIDGRGYKGRRWLCICECGNILPVLENSLKTKNTKSCGCIKKESELNPNYKHGEAKKFQESKEYNTWQRIKGRCYCKTNAKYYAYGERGIKMCDRWLNSFENFLSDMGRCPKDKYSIDRINNDGNYEPGNCKWSTIKEQAQNTRTNLYIEMDGVKLSLSQWCEKLNLKYEPTRRRITNKKMKLEDILKSNNVSVII